MKTSIKCIMMRLLINILFYELQEPFGGNHRSPSRSGRPRRRLQRERRPR